VGQHNILRIINTSHHLFWQHRHTDGAGRWRKRWTGCSQVFYVSKTRIFQRKPL